METAIISAEVGQIWRDEDGTTWRVVAFTDGGKWAHVKRHGYPHSHTIQTNPAWFTVWTKVSE